MKTKSFRSISCGWLLIAIVCLLLLTPMTSMAAMENAAVSRTAWSGGTVLTDARAGEETSSMAGREASSNAGFQKRLASQLSDFHHFLSIRSESIGMVSRTRSPLEQVLCAWILCIMTGAAMLFLRPVRLLCGAASSPLRFLRSIRLRN